MNKLMKFNFFYEVMMYINILYINIKFRVLSQDYSFLIIYSNYNCFKSL